MNLRINNCIIESCYRTKVISVPITTLKGDNSFGKTTFFLTNFKHIFWANENHWKIRTNLLIIVNKLLQINGLLVTVEYYAPKEREISQPNTNERKPWYRSEWKSNHLVALAPVFQKLKKREIDCGIVLWSVHFKNDWFKSFLKWTIVPLYECWWPSEER